MGQDEPDQQRLLLARGRRPGRHVLGTVADHEVAGLRPDQGAAGGPVAVAAIAQGQPEPVLRLDGGPDRDEIIEVPLQADGGPGEGLRIVPGLGDQPVEPLGGLAPGQRHRDAEFGHLPLHRVEPAVVVGSILQEAVPRAQGPLHRGDPRPVPGIDRQDEAVEEPAPVAGRAAEQPVEVGRQPDHPEELAEGHRRGGRRAVDAAEPACPPVRPGGLQPGAEPVLGAVPIEGDRDGEAARSPGPRHGGEVRPPQAPARHEQGDGFEQVGLAGAVLADQRDEPGLGREFEVGVVAEVAGDQAGNALDRLVRPDLRIEWIAHRRSAGLSRTALNAPLSSAIPYNHLVLRCPHRRASKEGSRIHVAIWRPSSRTPRCSGTSGRGREPEAPTQSYTRIGIST